MRILQEYVDVVILRDVVERHGIGNLAPLRYLIRHAPGMDRGRLLDTLVFPDLRRRGMEIAYFRSEQGYEVDFLARSSQGETLAVQVAESVADPKTRQRELRALEAVMAERKLSSATLVTLDDGAQIEVAGGAVAVVPAWRWLLRGE